MFSVYKGSPSLGLTKLSGTTTALAVVLTSLVIASLSVIFWLPYVYCKSVRKDYTIRFYHFFLGPLLWWRQPPADAADLASDAAVPDYRIVKRDGQEDRHIADEKDASSIEKDSESGRESQIAEQQRHAVSQPQPTSALEKEVENDPHPIEGAWAEPKNLYIILRYKSIPFIRKVLTHGITIDIHAEQAGKSGSRDAQRMEKVFAAAKQYPNEVEHMFSFIQVLTACTASFAHGANDVSNAIGPFAVIWGVWHTGDVASSKAPVPVWMLAFGGVMIVIGLATYGYNIMKVLGNKITLHSPSRGFSMELGSLPFLLHR
jgi:solute carrier family 20 (sodium-dependent phosphate transporter)